MIFQLLISEMGLLRKFSNPGALFSILTDLVTKSIRGRKKHLFVSFPMESSNITRLLVQPVTLLFQEMARRTKTPAEQTPLWRPSSRARFAWSLWESCLPTAKPRERRARSMSPEMVSDFPFYCLQE